MEILYTQEQIAVRVRELGKEISAAYRGKEPTVVIVASGGIVFGADLIRAIDIPLRLDFIAAASYEHHASTGRLELRSELKLDPAGADILLVDEVFDTGCTLQGLRDYMNDRGAASVAAAVMVVKQMPRPAGVHEVEFAGFRAPDRFLVGYGMDSDEKFRQLPWIAALD